MRTLDRLSVTAEVALVSTAVALLVLVPGVPGPLRALAAVWFFVAVPGAAWLHTLPVSGPVERVAVAVALSLGLDVVVAEVLLYVGAPGPVPAAFVLAGLTVAGVATEARRAPAEVPAEIPA